MQSAQMVRICPAAAYMYPHTCEDASQCFEPCGRLGHDSAHAQPAVNQTNPMQGKIQIGPLDV